MSDLTDSNETLSLDQAERAEAVASRFFAQSPDAARYMRPLYISQLRALGVAKPEEMLPRLP